MRFVHAGTATTAAFAARVPGIEAITPLQLSQEMEEAVEQQQDRAAEVEIVTIMISAASHPVHLPGPHALVPCVQPQFHYCRLL